MDLVEEKNLTSFIESDWRTLYYHGSTESKVLHRWRLGDKYWYVMWTDKERLQKKEGGSLWFDCDSKQWLMYLKNKWSGHRHCLP